MKLTYNVVLLALLAGALMWPAQARAQDFSGAFTDCPADQDECLVEWAADDGITPVVNALRNTIANDDDRPDGRVYVLERGGFYWITDPIEHEGFHLRLVGQTVDEAPDHAFVCGPNQDEDCGPAIIQRVYRETGDGPSGQMFNSLGGLTVKNAWLMGQDSQGNLSSYEPIKLLGEGATYVFDNVVFDRNDWHHLGPDVSDVDFYVTNSVFRNIFGPTQRWEGLGVRFEVGADTVVFENNTFFNIGFTPFQSEAAPMNYFRANHNTFVNVGRSFQAGAMWKEAYVTNNIFVNPFWQGEDEGQYGDPERDDPFTGFFGIGAMPARFGTDFEREIVLANNSYWRDPGFNAYYDEDAIRAQPFINDTTGGWFARYDGMVMQDNFIDVQPNLAEYIADQALIDSMVANISEIRAGNTPAPRYFWDPGRDEGCFVCNIWPLPEDFSYSNGDLLAGGTDGLPLGDLNWFPDDKTTFEANKEQYVADIEAMAMGQELTPVASIEGETASLEGEANVETAEGTTYFYMEGSGSIEWTFEAAEAGVYSLVVHTRAANADSRERGQHIRVDGTALRNDEGFGEYYWPDLPLEEWLAEEIAQANLIEGADALDLDAGEHTIEIAPSWGYQHFRSVDVVDPSGNTVAELTAPDAVAEGVNPACEEAEYCPQGFQAVALGAGGTASWAIDAPNTGTYMLRVFYASSSATEVEVGVNGTAVSNISFEADTSDVFSDQFEMDAGANTISFSSAAGGVTVDYFQLISVGAGTATEPNELPDGYALEQNYPNPFNPTTSIQYELGATDKVTLTVYDVLGRKVVTLVDGTQSPGQYQVQFDGASLSSGVYFYRLETAVGQQVRSMVLLK